MKIGFIGAGNMGSALASAAAKCCEIYAFDIDEKKACELAKRLSGKCSSLEEIAKTCDYVFLAVKPKFIVEVIENIKSIGLKDGAVLVSMAAGISLEKLEGAVENRYPIIRIMPNTPVAVGKGVVLTAGGKLVSEEKLLEFKRVMAAAGDIAVIDEALIDAGTALSGCSPAFVYMFIDALSEGACKAGIDKKVALNFAAKTLIGAATLLLESGKSPEELREAVCSPGGSTIEGVKSLFNDGFSEIVEKAVLASFKRTVELGK